MAKLIIRVFEQDIRRRVSVLSFAVEAAKRHLRAESESFRHRPICRIEESKLSATHTMFSQAFGVIGCEMSQGNALSKGLMAPLGRGTAVSPRLMPDLHLDID